MEIAEDAEEGPLPTSTLAEPPQSMDDSNNETKRLSQISDATAIPPTKNEEDPPTTSNVNDDESDARTETASMHSVSRKRFVDQFHRDSFDRRSSTQSARPTLQELNYAAPYRQKVKMEHRPSVDINNRPRTAGSMSRGQDYRPVAALPAGVRSRKPAGNPHRPKSTPDVPPVPTLASLRNAPPMPLLIPPPTLSIAKPKFSPGAKSMNAIPSSGMSPEKQRLMKALELRKKQMEKRTQDLQKKQEQKVATETQPPALESLDEDKENIGHSPVKRTASVVTLKQEPKTETKSPTVDTAEVDERKPLSADIAKADSAVEMASIVSKDIEPTAPQEELPNGTVLEEERSGDKENIEVYVDKKDVQPELEVEPTVQENTTQDNVIATTNLNEVAQQSQDETVTVTPDLETTANSPPASPRAEAVELPGGDNDEEPQDKETEGETLVEDTQQEETEEFEAPQANNEISHGESDASVDTIVEPDEPRLEDSALVVPTAAEEEDESEVRAENIPLPAESGDDLAEEPTTAGRQAALEPAVSTGQLQRQPLPQREELEKENENENANDRSEKHKRIALLEPIQVPTPDFSDDENLLSDDSLMEELTSATVQEAQPVSVGKGPLSPEGQPRTPLEAWQTRAVSNPGRRPSDFSSLPMDTRSISATFVDGNNQSIRPLPVMVAKKVNVSSGISKRIKALEMFSNNRDSVAGPGNLSAPTANNTTSNVASPTASAFEKFRKRASVSLNGNLPSTTPSARSSFISTSESIPLNRSDSRSLSKQNSVSVTARIVRDPSTPPAEPSANPMDTNVLGLQRSPLFVQHGSSDTPTSNSAPSDDVAELRSSAFSPKSSGRDSIDTTIPPRSDSRASSRSRFDDRSRDLGVSPSDDKRDSRTSRLMRRMSSLRSSSRKNLMSPPGIEKPQLPPSQHAEKSTQQAPSRAVDIGEVNVQFPDTLLWKRRYLRIDDQGYLVLTPGNMDTGARNIIKRYHLSDFKAPCLPDEERQELPNSILLDFRDGSTLQCACESRKGQAAALQSRFTPCSSFLGVRNWLTRHSSCRSAYSIS